MEKLSSLQITKHTRATVSLLALSGTVLMPAMHGQSAPPSAEKTWTPTQPITLARSGNSYMNLSLIGDFAAGANSERDTSVVQTGGHDPAQRGFTVQGLEAVFEGSVDHYFRAMANIVYALDTSGESFLEIEEAYLETFSLPGGFQLRAGQYLTEFGRINNQHQHAWDFVDAPLVSTRFFGPDGLRNPGARVSWLTPTPFYSELTFGIQNSGGATAHSFRGEEHDHGDEEEDAHHHADELAFGREPGEREVLGMRDLLYSARYALSFDISETQTLLGGISGAWGPNLYGERTWTQIYGADIYWKWKAANHHKGFPFVSFQAEAMFRGYGLGAATGEIVDHDAAEHAHIEVDLPRETAWDWGTYAQVNYGFLPGWIASLRADFTAPLYRAKYEEIFGEDDATRARRWRISPAISWYPSEFSRVRLQYNYDRLENSRSAHGVWLQVEFLLGSHGAHKF
ncbi:MAG: hypothetical protein LBS59_05680 [Puniceicoccales bacterium]|jgi:hypothetical protein|nr:hypothetical protein [Puniceicoccales bacterium]